MSNRFQGTGNLGTDPMLKHVDQDGESLAILELRVYFDRRARVDGGDEFEDRGGFWITASLFGSRAEAAANVLSKGMRIFASGVLVSDTWADNDSGELRVGMQLRVDYLALDLSRVASVRMVASKDVDQ